MTDADRLRAMLVDVATELAVWAATDDDERAGELSQTIREWLADPSKFEAVASLRDTWRAMAAEDPPVPLERLGLRDGR